MGERGRRFLSMAITVAIGVGLIAVLRNWGGDGTSGGTARRGNCVTLTLTASSEKAELVGPMAERFNQTATAADGRCVEVSVEKKSSGATMDALARGWDESIDGPKPDVWSPAGSSWVVLLRERLAAQDLPSLVGEDPASIAFSPQVIAMPRPMAEALGWPDAEIGWSDIYGLAVDPRGWGAVGHPEWGPFRLGKTNPNFSTSGLHALIGSYYAATGLTSDMTLQDVRSPKARAFVEGVESSVYHYGDISLTFLANMYEADQRGDSLEYVSAVAIEEKSVWDYNQGNPEGDPETLGERPKPTVPLAAVYPKEGVLVSDHPYAVLSWIEDDRREVADAFLTFLQEPAQQDVFRGAAFRGFDGEPGPLTTQANGFLPSQPTTVLSPPSPRVLDEVQRSWTDLRKPARVIVLMDTSGSMENENKMNLAKEAADRALDLFSPGDQVSLWSFSDDTCTEQTPMGAIGEQEQALRDAIASLREDGNTPLYECTRATVDALADADASTINGVVILSDGVNSVGGDGDDDLEGLLNYLEEQDVRVFPIAFGSDADPAVLGEIAAAARGAAYDAADPTSIDGVFVSVISNF
jgi:Ca-activated chloride channel family protein